MVSKIVSGGQTGVDRAALDFALDHEITCGGWCPLDRLAEDGPLHERYPLKETPERDYTQRTEWNVRDSDGTLVLTWGPPSDGTAFTIGMARKHERPCMVVDLADDEPQESVTDWIGTCRIQTLNVAGPRASKHRDIYRQAYEFLRSLEVLEEID
jgi:hypothetical protein